MGKKRRVGQPFGARVNKDPSEVNGGAHFKINEEFNDSEDDFHEEKDEILFEDEPVNKPRKQIEEKSTFLSIALSRQVAKGQIQMLYYRLRMKKSLGTSLLS